jgi:hypothetical protein
MFRQNSAIFALLFVLIAVMCLSVFPFQKIRIRDTIDTGVGIWACKGAKLSAKAQKSLLIHILMEMTERHSTDSSVRSVIDNLHRKARCTGT